MEIFVEMIEQHLVIIAAVGLVVLLGGIIALSTYLERRRRDMLWQMAEGMGFTFSPEGDQALVQELGGFHLFSRGRHRKTRNLLRGRTREGPVSIFDYSYVTGSGKSQHTERQTVACFELDVSLPRFSLAPERAWHKIGAWLGHEDIDFDDYPFFSEQYLLKGDDEEAVRMLFSGDVLEYFEANQGLCVEGGGRWMLFCQGSRRVKPEEVEWFMEQGLDVVAHFRPRR